VKSVLSSLPVYLLTVIKAPKKFLKEIDKMRKKFLWASNGELTGRKCKEAWPKVCTPHPQMMIWASKTSIILVSHFISDGCGLAGTPDQDLGRACRFL
jgi:hypothetical protein